MTPTDAILALLILVSVVARAHGPLRPARRCARRAARHLLAAAPRALVLALGAVAIAVVGGQSGALGSLYRGARLAQAQSQPAVHQVRITDAGFEPSAITIGVGESV